MGAAMRIQIAPSSATSRRIASMASIVLAPTIAARVALVGRNSHVVTIPTANGETQKSVQPYVPENISRQPLIKMSVRASRGTRKYSIALHPSYEINQFKRGLAKRPHQR